MNAEQEYFVFDRDVSLLAMMCMVCDPVVTIKSFFGIVKERYAYYIPNSDTELEIAKGLFSNHGIQMHVHSSRYMSGGGTEQKILRAKYGILTDSDKIYRFARRIELRRLDLFKTEAIDERKILNKQIEKLKEQYKGR